MNIENPIKDHLELKKIFEDRKYILIEEGIDNKGTINEEFKYSIWLAPGGILKVMAPSQNHIKLEFVKEISEFSCKTRNIEIKEK